MRKILYIINPKSGTGASGTIEKTIRELSDSTLCDFQIRFTERAGHATSFAAEAVKDQFDVVVAVGGDGSVNETAAALVNTTTALGIIPTGSGNGMARHLRIPVNVEKAIRTVQAGTTEAIDTLAVNDRFCIGTIGVGFDAHIAHLFAKASKRGYSTYVKLVLTEFSTYKEKRFSILVDGKLFERKCFLLTFANSSQFGNNAVIAPFADVQDSITEISILRRFPAIAAPLLIYRLMTNSISRSSYFESLKGHRIVLKNNEELPGHIDGEPVTFHGDLTIIMNPLSLKVVVPKK